MVFFVFMVFVSMSVSSVELLMCFVLYSITSFETMWACLVIFLGPYFLSVDGTIMFSVVLVVDVVDILPLVVRVPFRSEFTSETSSVTISGS